MTPNKLKKLTVHSPPIVVVTSDSDPFDEVLTDTQITLYQPPPGIDVTYTPIENVKVFPVEMAKIHGSTVFEVLLLMDLSQRHSVTGYAPLRKVMIGNTKSHTFRRRN